jgi:hypothetical protein
VFTRSLRLYPTDVWELNNRGVGYMKLGTVGKARREFEAAVERAYTRIQPRWSFVIRLCRELQKGEDQFTPGDAFWIGLIDEIQGTRLRRR